MSLSSPAAKSIYIILSLQDTALVNALQRTAAVVLQKSLREGFGLTVTEAMRLGKKARETVAKHFLLTSYVVHYLDLFNSFETVYRLKKRR